MHLPTTDERTVILVEHKMKLVMGISDRLLVLHHGEVLAEGTPDDLPPVRREKYEQSGRNSKVLVKKLKQG